MIIQGLPYQFDALLLAAGIGSRLKPYTNKLPKCLIPINNKPLLEYWLCLLADSEYLNQVFINTHYLHEKVHKFVDSHRLNSKITTLYENELLGTAGTFQALCKRLRNNDILLAHADNLSRFNLDGFIESHRNRPKNCLMTMMTFDPPDPTSCGIVTSSKNGVVLSYVEKPTQSLKGDANGAVYLISKDAFLEIENFENIYDFSRDVVPKFTGRIFMWKNQDYHRDIGTPQSYEIACREFLN